MTRGVLLCEGARCSAGWVYCEWEIMDRAVCITKTDGIKQLDSYVMYVAHTIIRTESVPLIPVIGLVVNLLSATI